MSANLDEQNIFARKKCKEKLKKCLNAIKFVLLDISDLEDWLLPRDSFHLLPVICKNIKIRVSK